MSTDPTALDPITTARVIVTSPNFETIKAHSDPEWRGLAQIIETLALAVARVEVLADMLEAEGTAGVRVPNRTPHDSGWHDSQIIAASRIRTALNGGDK